MKNWPDTPEEPTLSDKLYFGTFAVRKMTISDTFKHPILGKEVCHKFYIGDLVEYRDTKKFEKDKRGYDIDKSDSQDQLKDIIHEPQDGMVFYWFEVCDGSKRLPLHYAAVYTWSHFLEPHPLAGGVGIKPAWQNYFAKCDKRIDAFVRAEKMPTSCFKDLKMLFNDFGAHIFKELEEKDSECTNEAEDVEWLDEWRVKFGEIKDPATRNYALAVLGSAFKRENANRNTMQCQCCGRYIKYRLQKKYCSLAVEGRDCGKAVRNKKYYGKHKEVIKPKARINSKETRDFYKKRGIKKYPT